MKNLGKKSLILKFDIIFSNFSKLLIFITAVQRESLKSAKIVTQYFSQFLFSSTRL